MDFKTEFPDYAAVEKLVRRARAERSVYLADTIANAVLAAWNSVKWLADLRPARLRASRWVAGNPFARESIARD